MHNFIIMNFVIIYIIDLFQNLTSIYKNLTIIKQCFINIIFVYKYAVIYLPTAHKVE